jgi:hypothetical protein
LGLQAVQHVGRGRRDLVHPGLGHRVEIGQNQDPFIGAGCKKQLNKFVPRCRIDLSRGFGLGSGVGAGRGRCHGKLAKNGRRSGGITGQPGRDRGAGRRIDGLDQPQRQFDKLDLFVGGVDRLLYIEIRQHAQQGRADIDAVPACQVE